MQVVDTFELLPALVRGNLRETSAPELVAAVFRSRASGTLWLETAAGAEIRVFFRAGDMCGTGAFEGSQTLAHVLLANDWVNALDIDGTREEAARSQQAPRRGAGVERAAHRRPASRGAGGAAHHQSDDALAAWRRAVRLARLGAAPRMGGRGLGRSGGLPRGCAGTGQVRAAAQAGAGVAGRACGAAQRRLAGAAGADRAAAPGHARGIAPLAAAAAASVRPRLRPSAAAGRGAARGAAPLRRGGAAFSACARGRGGFRASPGRRGGRRAGADPGPRAARRPGAARVARARGRPGHAGLRRRRQGKRSWSSIWTARRPG